MDVAAGAGEGAGAETGETFILTGALAFDQASNSPSCPPYRARLGSGRGGRRGGGEERDGSRVRRRGGSGIWAGARARAEGK